MSTIKIKGAKITYRDDNIIHVHYEDKLFNLEEVKFIFETTRQNSPWVIAPVYITGNSFTNQEPEAKEYSGSSAVMNHCSAIAFLSKTIGEKMMANFFIKFIKPSKPTKFFSNEDDAINWLKQFKTVLKE